jgi:hypothetical protein
MYHSNYGFQHYQKDTVIFFILCNSEMKEEIYCFVIFMIAKYGRLYIIIVPIVESFSSQMKIVIIKYFIRDERNSMIMIGNLSSDYDTNAPYLAVLKFTK